MNNSVDVTEKINAMIDAVMFMYIHQNRKIYECVFIVLKP